MRTVMQMEPLNKLTKWNDQHAFRQKAKKEEKIKMLADQVRVVVVVLFNLLIVIYYFNNR